MKLRETIGAIWSYSRWYRFISILTILLLVVKSMLLGTIGTSSFDHQLYSVTTLAAFLAKVFWAASTITVIYLFLQTEKEPTVVQNLPNRVSARPGLQFKEILVYVWKNNRWYVYFSVITLLSLLGAFVLGVMAKNMAGASYDVHRSSTYQLYQVFSEFSFMLAPVWIVWTIKVAYYFKPDEIASVPAPVVRGVKTFLLSLFLVVVVLFVSFAIVMMLVGGLART